MKMYKKRLRISRAHLLLYQTYAHTLNVTWTYVCVVFDVQFYTMQAHLYMYRVASELERKAQKAATARTHTIAKQIQIKLFMTAFSIHSEAACVLACEDRIHMNAKALYMCAVD